MITAISTYQQLKNVKAAYSTKFSCIYVNTATVFTVCGIVEGLPLAVIYEDSEGKPADFNTDFSEATEVSKIVL